MENNSRPAHFIGHNDSNCVSLHSDGIWKPLRLVVLYLVESGGVQWHKLLIPVMSYHGTAVCGLQDGHLTESLSIIPVISLNPLKSMR